MITSRAKSTPSDPSGARAASVPPRGAIAQETPVSVKRAVEIEQKRLGGLP